MSENLFNKDANYKTVKKEILNQYDASYRLEDIISVTANVHLDRKHFVKPLRGMHLIYE